MGHPLRQKIQAHLDANGPATATLVAAACEIDTGTASYHLRVLGAAGLIEDDPTPCGRGRQRWWRSVPIDHREPGYEQLDRADREVLDKWRQAQLPDELDLARRFVTEFRSHGDWAKASRSRGWYTEQGLQDLMNGYVALLTRHSIPEDTAPSDARKIELRLFFLPTAENDTAENPLDPAPDDGGAH